MARAKPTYYVQVDTYWQGSPDHWAGPYSSRDLAQQAIETTTTDVRSLAVEGNQGNSDIRNGIRIWGIKSKTEARRLGMRDWALGDEMSNVIPRIPLSTSDLSGMGG